MRKYLPFVSPFVSLITFGCDSTTSQMMPIPTAPTYLAVTASDYVAGSGTLSLLDPETVSYTHLDVYKRQSLRARSTGRAASSQR